MDGSKANTHRAMTAGSSGRGGVGEGVLEGEDELEDEDEDVDSIDTVYGKLKKKFPLVQKRAIVETIEPILLYPWYGTGGWDL